MAINNENDFRNAKTTIYPFGKYSVATGAAQCLYGDGFLNSRIPLAGALPVGAATDFTARDNTSLGALSIPNASSGNTRYLSRLMAVTDTSMMLMLYDRLADMTAVRLKTGAYTWTGSYTAARPTSGEGVELWLYISTSIGSTSNTLTITYIDTEDQTKTTTVICVNMNNYRIVPVSLAPGSKGLKRVTAVSGSGGTTGYFAMVLLRPIACVPLITPSTMYSFTWPELGMPVIPDNCCLTFALNGGNVNGYNPTVNGVLYFKEG